jgi:hypothetical protein
MDATMPTDPTSEVIDFADIDGVSCPCGSAQRAFADSGLCTLHTVTISADAATYYHKTHTEVYYFLEKSGEMELDGAREPVHPGMSIFIHQASGTVQLWARNL